MADIGFHRADWQRRCAGAVGVAGNRVADRLGLDRIADQGAGAMRLKIGELRRRQPAAIEHLAQQGGLRGAVRQRQPDRAAGRVGAGAADHGANMVAIGQRIGQPLDHHRAGALGTHIAVRPCIEGMAAPGRRQHRGAREANELRWRQQHVHPADDRRR